MRPKLSIARALRDIIILITFRFLSGFLSYRCCCCWRELEPGFDSRVIAEIECVQSDVNCVKKENKKQLIKQTLNETIDTFCITF